MNVTNKDDRRMLLQYHLNSARIATQMAADDATFLDLPEVALGLEDYGAVIAKILDTLFQERST